MSAVLVIDRARVITPIGVVEGHVRVADGRIVAVEPGPLADVAGSGVAAPDVIDAEDAWLSAGFIDLQINGAYGIDVTTEPHRIDELGAHLVRHGVTSFLPTVITCAGPQRAAALDAIAARTAAAVDADPRPGSRATPLGLHMEGPMLSPVRRGAHPAEYLVAPTLDAIDGWSAAAGVALVTIAPELPGALDVIAALRSRGVVVSIGHTDCTASEFVGGRVAGASMVTHLFNAMRPFAHRDPGPIGAALADPWVVTGLIADGVHVDPVAVAMAFRSRGPDRLALVTDAVAAMGAATSAADLDRRPGVEAPQVLGSVGVVVGDGEVRTAGGVLAGSVCPLDRAVRNLIAWTECGVPSAVRTVTATPARLLGRRDLGAIEPGARADLVLLDRDANVRTTIVAGEVAWRS